MKNKHVKIYAEQGVGQIFPSRRSLMLGGLALSSASLLGVSSGCGNSSDDSSDEVLALQLFALGASAIATGGVGELALLGLEVGYLALKAYTEKQISQKSRPAAVPVRYAAKAEQGSGKVYDYPALPTVGNGKAVSTLSADGPGYVSTYNPTEEPISNLKLLDAEGHSSDLNDANESFLAGLPQAWAPGAGLYLLGLRSVAYKRIEAKTGSGRLITIDLV